MLTNDNARRQSAGNLVSKELNLSGGFMAASIRIGCIGCGGHAITYLQPCLAISESFELIAVCDLDAAKAEQSARRFGWQHWYSNWHTMLEQEQLDAVVVCAPPAVHE
jgi:predicted dehydrogenase